MKVSLKQLEILHAVAVSGSISRAMRRLDMSQPNISQQLARMEEALGTQLLVRSRGFRTDLTPAGMFWAASAARILASVEASETRHNDLFVERGLTLGFGATPSFTGPFTELLARIALSVPRLAHLDLFSAPTSQDLVERLMTHRRNVALLRGEAIAEHRASLHVLSVHEDRLVWVVPQIVPEDVVRACLAGAPVPPGHPALLRYTELRTTVPWSAQTQGWYAGALPEAQPYFGCSMHESAVRIVAAGHATCHIPSSLIPNLPLEVRARVRFYAAEENGREMVIAMARHLNSVRPFHDFVEALAAALRADYAPEKLDLKPLPGARPE